MDKEIELSRWRDRPRGVGYRRWTIIWTGLKGLLRTKLILALVFISWIAGFGIAGLGFLASQAVAPGGWFEQLAANLGGTGQATIAIIGGMLTLYPDVWVRTLYTGIFWVHSFAALGLSLIAITILIPHLIARDRGTGALVIYLSRPLTSTDYLLSKLGIVAGILTLTWIGPLLFGWIVSLLLAPDTDFIIYSITPMLRALGFAGIAFVVLGTLALAVSALNKTSGAAIMTWIGLWFLASAVAGFDSTPNWLRRASFTHDLLTLRQEAFRLDTALTDLAASMPFQETEFAANVTQAAKAAAPESPTGALVGLAMFVAASSFVFTRRIRPE